MHAPEPGELRLFEPGDHAEDASLLAVFELGLEADDVEEGAERIVLPELDDRVGLDLGIMGVGEAERLHRPMAQGLAAALGHHFDRQAAVEIGRALEFAKLGLLRREKRVDEGLVLVAGHRAVDVSLGAAARPFLVVARLHPCHAHVDRVAMHDRRDRVEEGERALAGQPADRLGQRFGGERPGGDDDIVPVLGRQAGDLVALDGYERMAEDGRFDAVREAVAVDRERSLRPAPDARRRS